MNYIKLERVLGRALKAAGNQDRYQFIVVSILCAVFFVNIFLIVGPSIYFMDPVFQCIGSDEIQDESYACSRLY